MECVPVIMVLILATIVQSVPESLMYPYGLVHGDSRLPSSDDISSEETILFVPIIFYNSSFSSIYVNMNGHVSFETEIPAYRGNFVLPFGLKVIAPFLADVDTRAAGDVYYRETQDFLLLQRAANDVQSHFRGMTFFQPQSLFIVTWDKVGYFNQQSDKVNTFQLVLASDAISSFAFFHYLDRGMQWLASQGKLSQFVGDIPAQAGFDGGQQSFMLPFSGTTTAFVNNSNVNIPGVWMYQIGNTGSKGNIKEADLNTGALTVFKVGVDNSCHEGAHQCHINAHCIEFDQDFCCQCLPPFYGNGKHCLEPDVPQRVNGRVQGIINGIILSDLDMHTYIVTSDGRSYSAISRVPSSIGPAIQILNTIGGAIGWLFALPTSIKAVNGYSITGGVFNRTSVVNFHRGNRTVYTVRIVQQFLGHDALNNLRMDSYIDGNLPNFASGSKITIDDYTENYKKLETGLIKSFAVRTFRVNEVAFRYTWDTTITYNECRTDLSHFLATMHLSVTRNYVIHSEKDQVVRFAMSNKVTVLTGSDPCLNDASHVCHEQADCIPSDMSFRCVCRAGYEGDGFRCQGEVQLCQDHHCSEHAHCVHTSKLNISRCECNTGFQGNGTSCIPIRFGCNEVDICGENAECMLDTDTNIFKCQCIDDFSGDGYSCEPLDRSDCKNCHKNAECLFDIERLIYKCHCLAGFTGDGFTCTALDSCGQCDINADCELQVVSNSFQCKCHYGFWGDGIQCKQYDCQEDKVCSSNAQCIFNTSLNAFLCQCKPGYKGDGFHCESEGCDTHSDCDVNARCLVDSNSLQYVCQCNPGYHGTGKICYQKVVPCNQINNCDRHAECVYDPDRLSYRCRCSRNYEGDGYTCLKKDVTDCRKISSLCDQNASCMEGSDGGFLCVCNTNFRGDGFKCTVAEKEGDYLIYAQGYKLMKIASESDTGEHGQQLLYIPGQLAAGIDTDCEESHLYWTDAAYGFIRKAYLNGSAPHILLAGLGSPEGIAIDYISRNLYFTDSKMDTLEVVKLEGSYRKTLIDTDMVNPRSIVLNINRGVLYWTDWNRNQPQIEKANMDGTSRQVFVHDGLALPNGLAFDLYSEQLCWIDAGTKLLECIRSDGMGRRIISSASSHPFGIAILNNILFWTDWNRRHILSVNQAGGEENIMKNTFGGNGKLYGITAVRNRCRQATNSCAINNGGCDFLCLPTQNGGRTCACPDSVDPRVCQDSNA